MQYIEPHPKLRIALSFTLGAIAGIVLSLAILMMMGYSPRTTIDNTRRWLSWSASPMSEPLEGSIEDAKKRLEELKAIQQEFNESGLEDDTIK